MDCHKAGFVHESETGPLPSKLVMLVSSPMLWRVIDIIDTTDTQHFEIGVLAKPCNRPVIINTAEFQQLPKLTASQVMKDIDHHCCLQPETICAEEYILYNVSPKLAGVEDQGILLKQFKFLLSQFSTGCASWLPQYATGCLFRSHVSLTSLYKFCLHGVHRVGSCFNKPSRKICMPSSRFSMPR